MYPSYSSLEVPTGGKEKDKGVSSEPLRMSRATLGRKGCLVYRFALCLTAPASVQLASPRSYTWPAATSILRNC